TGRVRTMGKRTSELKGNALGSNRAESDNEMLDKAVIETSDYKTRANGPAYNAVVGRRGAGKSALFLMLTRHFSEREDVAILAVKPKPSTFVGLAGHLRESLGAHANYVNARDAMRHACRACFYAH